MRQANPRSCVATDVRRSVNRRAPATVRPSVNRRARANHVGPGTFVIANPHPRSFTPALTHRRCTAVSKAGLQ